MVAEWWSSEFRALLCGWLPTEAQATKAVAANGVLFVLTVVCCPRTAALPMLAGILLFTGDVQTPILKIVQQTAKTPP